MRHQQNTVGTIAQRLVILHWQRPNRRSFLVSGPFQVASVESRLVLNLTKDLY